MRHPALPLWGVQFHPEDWDAGHPDGRRVLQNFFEVAATAAT
jgi:anthranilate/para-aminobenzoate synthase component II